METKSKTGNFSDDDKSFPIHDHLPPAPLHSHLDDLGHQIDEINAESIIQTKYYEEYKKIYFTAFKLWCEVRKQFKIKDNLATRVTSLESQLTNLHRPRRPDEEGELPDDGDNDSKRKNSRRMRRTAEEIERKFVCTADFCDRCYGSEGSLQQHIKMKHPEMFRRETESEEF